MATIASIGTRSATTCTGSIVTTVLTVTGASGGTIRIGDLLTGGTVSAQTYIQSFGTGTGGNGTYNVNNSQTASCTGVTNGYGTIPNWSNGFLTGGWIGYMYNDAQYSITSDWNSQGNSTSATDYMLLTTGPGQSFKDAAGVQSNALRYNQSNGVAISVSGGAAFMRPAAYLTLTNLQVTVASGSGGFCYAGGGHPLEFDNCILEWYGAGGTNGIGFHQGLTTITNCIVVDRSGGGDTLMDQVNNQASGINFVAANNTFINEAASPTGICVDRLDGGDRLINNAIFGYATLVNVQNGATYTNTCTDKSTAPGSSNQVSKTAANQFVDAGGTGGSGADATRDFRLKANTTDCSNNGATDTTDIPSAIDIVYTSRPQSTGWDIGAWEYVSAAPPAGRPNFMATLGVG